MTDSTSRNFAPVGVFDSGVGGLSILQAIHRLLPDEQLIYLADHAYAPYGDKTPEQIVQRSTQVVDYLIARGCKAVVIACNTATAAAAADLRATHRVPIIGVEPGVKPAVSNSRVRRIGVLATQYTVVSEKFKSLVANHAEGVQLVVQGAPGLVETIEQPGDNSARLTELLSAYLRPMVAAGIDQLVLGCTHYSFLAAEIRAHLPDSIELIDTPEPVARELKRRLDAAGLLASPRSERLADEFLTTTADTGHISQLVSRLLGRVVEVRKVSF